MVRIMTADEAVSLIQDGDVIAMNSFLGIDNPVELHEALYKRYHATGSPRHLTNDPRRLFRDCLHPFRGQMTGLSVQTPLC